MEVILLSTLCSGAFVVAIAVVVVVFLLLLLLLLSLLLLLWLLLCGYVKMKRECLTNGKHDKRKWQATTKRNGGHEHYVMVSEIQWKPF